MAERMKMSLTERAKQFAPFAALHGFEYELEKARRKHFERTDSCYKRGERNKSNKII